MTAVSDETGRDGSQRVVEDIILRRLHNKRIEGYTLEMSKEIVVALSAAPVAQEPVAYRYRSSIDPDWIYHDERLPPHDMAWQDEGLEEQGLYRSTPAGVGVDEIVRIIDDAINKYGSLMFIQEHGWSGFCTKVREHVLALLSRAGDQK